MGLDQSWYVESQNEEFYYHRKVPSLESFMADKYRELGGEGEFNCERLDITTAILDELEEAVTNNTLDENATGFFWGKFEPQHNQGILEAVSLAREKLADGHKVYYKSCW